MADDAVTPDYLDRELLPIRKELDRHRDGFHEVRKVMEGQNARILSVQHDTSAFELFRTELKGTLEKVLEKIDCGFSGVHRRHDELVTRLTSVEGDTALVKSRVELIEKIVFRACGLILVAVVGALIALVVQGKLP